MRVLYFAWVKEKAGIAAEVAESLVGPDNVVRDLPPSMGAEDFSFMLQVRPGAFARLGQGGAEGGCFLHNSRYDFNDAVIPLGGAYLAALESAATYTISGDQLEMRTADDQIAVVMTRQ